MDKLLEWALKNGGWMAGVAIGVLVWSLFWPRLKSSFISEWQGVAQWVGFLVAAYIGASLGYILHLPSESSKEQHSVPPIAVTQSQSTNANPSIQVNPSFQNNFLLPVPTSARKENNKYVCVNTIKPLFGIGKSAILIEFGVKHEPTKQFHTQIQLSESFLEVRQWLGPPRRTDFYGMEFHDGAEGVKIANAIPELYDITGCIRPVTPHESIYVYFAGDTSLHQGRITFSEDASDPDLIMALESDYDDCPKN